MNVKRLCLVSLLLLIFSVPQIYQQLHSYQHHQKHHCHSHPLQHTNEKLNAVDDNCAICDYTFSSFQPFQAFSYAYITDVFKEIHYVLQIGSINNTPYLINDARAPPLLA